MGQKVNPHGLRVGIIKDWDSHWFVDKKDMAANIKDGGLSMKLVDGTGNEPAQYGFAIFNADNQELVDMFNAGLANIKANGTYDEIIAKYLGE